MRELDPSFWQAIYDEKPRPGWDLDGPSPLLAEALGLTARLGLALGPDLAVPGCGFGHDAADLARRGHRVTGVDFVPAALQGARARHGDLARWLEADWFAPSGDTYDGIFDYTCFVAMAPERRADYVAACARHLKPGGLWLGGFFHTVGAPGPPFALSMDELRALAAPRFEILHLDHAQHSHPRRAGREFLLVARKQAGGVTS
jgi:methyl halide transferase